MPIKINKTSIANGCVTILVAAATASLYVWVETVHIQGSRFTGEQIFLLPFAPIAACGLLYFLARGLQLIWSGLTRYTVADYALIIHSPVGTRQVPWSTIDDFLLPPAKFPKAPEALVLLLAQNRRMVVSIARFREAGAEPLLLAFVPGLAEWGLERVKTPLPTACSVMAVRWRLYKASMLSLYGMLVLFLFTTVGCLTIAWNSFNYLRIRQSHVSAQAKITNITTEPGRHGTVWATIRYTALNGQIVRLRREVRPDFADRFRLGDRVTVDYLRSDPLIGRIPGWDLDGRQWILLVILLPFTWATYRVTRNCAANCLGPLRERLAWSSQGSAPYVTFSGANLKTLFTLVPEKHIGIMMLKPSRSGSQGRGVREFIRAFEQAGIQASQAAFNLLALATDQARRMLNRMGGDQAGFPGDYMVLECPTTEAAERLLQEQWANSQSEKDQLTPPQIRLYCLKRFVGPLDTSGKRELFQGWITQRLGRLYGGALPADVPEIEFADLLDMDPADGQFDLLIERRRGGPRLWLYCKKPGRAWRADCLDGHWSLLADVPVPRILKSRCAKVTVGW